MKCESKRLEFKFTEELSCKKEARVYVERMFNMTIRVPVCYDCMENAVKEEMGLVVSQL